MKLSTIILLLVLGTLTALPSTEVQAAPLGIPAAVYPRGAHIGYRPVLTNAEMDCLWGFICESGLPNFHLNTQDQLHRLSGWAQFAGIQRHGRTTMAFELFVSRYDPAADATAIPWSRQAFLDLKAAIRAQGYHLDHHDADLLPATRAGGTLLATQPLGKQDLVVMAYWSGSLEVEGIALYDHHPSAPRQIAWTSLALQLHLASKD